MNGAVPLAPGESLALARALYAQAQAVAQFIDEKVRVPVDERTPTIALGVVFQGQLLRAIAWLRSLASRSSTGSGTRNSAGTSTAPG